MASEWCRLSCWELTECKQPSNHLSYSVYHDGGFDFYLCFNFVLNMWRNCLKIFLSFLNEWNINTEICLLLAVWLCLLLMVPPKGIPDVILCGWLGSKHQLTNKPTPKGGRGSLMPPSRLESWGYLLSSLFYLFSCSSTYSRRSFCLVLFFC